MAGYRERVADDLVRAALNTFGAVIIEGPRASGKTTTGRKISASWVALDADPNAAELARISPGSILNGTTPRLIDEWQLAPSLWNSVRHEVDNRRATGQFILTGSATPDDDTTRHSGAGRFGRVTLRPMTLFESGDSTGQISAASLLEPAASRPSIGGLGGPTVERYAELVVRGGWPALVDRPSMSPGMYLRSYLDDVSRVDLPGAVGRVDPMRVSALIHAIARNVSTEATAVKLAKEAELTGNDNKVSAQTARKYIDALSRVFVVEEQPPWAPHLRSSVRLNNSPKWHFVDPSLAAAALGADPGWLLADMPTFGLLFESLCIRDLRVLLEPAGGAVYHYRDASKLEVDAVVDTPSGRWSAFEIKMGDPAKVDQAAKSLKALAGKVSDARRESLMSLNVITAGKVSFTREDGVNVIALGHLRL